MGKKITIPHTDLSLFPIGLGTAQAGLGRDEREYDRVFDAYTDCGGNVIDTAHVYSDWVPGEWARSERVVGDWLFRSGKRNGLVLMTKGGHPDMRTAHPDLHRSRMSRAEMTKDLDESLQKLRTDRIDIYFYHRDDRSQPVEEEMEVMQDLVRAGKIRYFACSNWDADRMRAADDYCRVKGYRSLAADQSLLNLGMKYFKGNADDTLCCIDGEIARYHAENPDNLAMPYMANCGGFFQAYAAKGEDGVRGSVYDTQGNRRAAARLQELCAQRGCSLTQAVLGFLFCQPFACLPLYGTGSAERVIDACGAADVPFTAADYAWVLE